MSTPRVRTDAGASVGQQADHPEWHIRIDRRYEFKAPGASAMEKANELAADRTGFDTYRDRMRGIRGPDWAWRRGAIGEQLVGRQLDQLPSRRWAVVHDLTIGSRGANLDHLVIGPPGVFTINTKHLTGNITVYDRAILQNGRRTDFIPKALREAQLVQERLSAATGRELHAWSVIVIVGAQVTIQSRPSDLTVASSNGLLRWFVQQPADVIDAGFRLTLERVARSPDTWLPGDKRAVPAVRGTTQAEVLASTEPADGLAVRRWARYGKDRLYVSTRAGDTLGWVDLVTSAVHSEDPRHRDLVERAAQRWRADRH